MGCEWGRREVVANISRVFKVGMTGEVGEQSMLYGYQGERADQVEGMAGTKVLTADRTSHI